jgi:hypothetical protein
VVTYTQSMRYRLRNATTPGRRIGHSAIRGSPTWGDDPVHSQHNPLALSASEGLNFGDEAQNALAYETSATEGGIPDGFVTRGSGGVR